MLKSLHIENIAVIEKTDIDFSAGFNCLTGETGAGKSIIIDSINAVLGERTSKELIRAGAEKAEVTALFTGLSKEALFALDSNGYSADTDGNVLIMRVLSGSGGSIKINGKPSTVGVLKEISKSLVNIHGQHDSQNLLNPDNHVNYIDKIAENGDIIAEYYALFKELNAVRRELAAIETDEGEKARKTELLKYQINDIESAEITVGETEKLKEKLKLINNREKNLAALNDAYRALCGTDESDGALSLIRNAQKEIGTVGGEKFAAANQKLCETLSLLEEVSYDIRKNVEDDEFSEENAETVRERLDTLRSLMLKYGGSEEKVLEFLSGAKTELENITLSDKKIVTLSKKLDELTEKLVEAGFKVTESRKNASRAFSKKVTETLLYLNMPDAEFSTEITQGKYTKNGSDIVEFYIKTNAGDTKKPLCKIASGGELSRVMLAIKSVLADKDDVDTLIFDEIDTGISGRAADKVGIQLKSVSACRQVICVTHLAQIAAYSQNHLLIEKNVKDGKTYTGVTALKYEERIEELARIMSGTDLTDNLYNSAKELLDRSR